jgi:CRISPR-associated protein Cas1
MDDDAAASALPISLVAHTVFCPRRVWLEASGETVESEAMTIGELVHRPSDDGAASTTTVRRAVDVEDVAAGITGRCDAVDVDADGGLQVVEYKATPMRKRPEPTEALQIQVALQAQALRAMGETVTGAAVYFTTHNVRVPIDLTEDLTRRAHHYVVQTREIITSPTAPPVLIDDRRCNRCSHVSVCLPDENAQRPRPRRVSVLDPDTQVLYLHTYGSRASLRRGQIVVEKDSVRLGAVPVERIQAVSVHGNVDISAAATREMIWRDIPIIWCTSAGRIVGWSTSNRRPNAVARHWQHLHSAAGRIDIASAMISAKIANQATLARRALTGSHPSVPALRHLSTSAARATTATELLGIEGDAAARYFAAFPSMLTQAVRDDGLSLPNRHGRNAPDPANALLNYAYSLLLGDIIKAITSCGLDPHAGFLHTATRNKPALALDLMEEFRAPIADSTVLRLLNNGEIRNRHFTTALGPARLTPAGRNTLIHAYEARVTTELKHPTMQYVVTWRRAMAVQARLLLGVLDGTSAHYRPIRIR